MAYQETAAEQIERYKVIPSFARDFRNKSLVQQTEIFEEFGIKHAVHRKMFEFLCVLIQDALVRTGRAFTTYKYYMDSVLRWSSNPNNLRSLPGFPRSEDTLRHNFEPLLGILVEKGLVIVEEDPRNRDEWKTISFALEDTIKSNAEVRELEKVSFLLGGEYAKIKAGAPLPLPTRRQVEKALEHELGPKIRVTPFPPQKYTKRDLAKYNFSETDFFEIDFGSQYLVLVPPGYMALLKDIGAQRLLTLLQDASLVKRLDALLLTNSGETPPMTVASLLFEKVGRLPAFEKHLVAWLALIKQVLAEIREHEGTTMAGRVKFYPIFLLYTWLLQEQRDEQLAVAETRFFETLYANLSELKRALTADELHYTEVAQAYIQSHSLEEYESLFERFVQGWSLRTNPRKAETIIQLTSASLGTVYIQSRNALEAFAVWPMHEEKQIDDLVESNWIRPLVEKKVSPEIRQAMSSDERFDAQFAGLLQAALGHDNDARLFFALSEFFSKNTLTMSSLAGRSGIPAGRFLAQGEDGKLQLRPLAQLCNWNRQRIMEEVESRIPFMRKLVAAFKGLFGGGEKKAGQTRSAKKKTAATNTSASQGKAAKGKNKAGGDSKKEAKSTNSGEGLDAVARAKALQKALPKDRKPASPDEMFTIFSKGKSKAQHLAIWNRQIGQAADENKRIVDEMVSERLVPLKRKLKSGDKMIDVGLQASYVLNSPRLDGLQNKDSLLAYVCLSMLEDLEEFRKGNRLSFMYLAKK